MDALQERETFFDQSLKNIETDFDMWGHCALYSVEKFTSLV